MSRRTITVVVAIAGLLLGVVPTADAFHWYRGPADDCTSADGALTDDQTSPGDADTQVLLGHTTYHDASSGAPVSRIDAGDSVTWDWASSHCHSVTFGDPVAGTEESGTALHYPQEAPESDQAVEGFFEYPVLDETPTLSYSRTFDEAGTYSYYCIHHWYVGMQGTVVVE